MSNYTQAYDSGDVSKVSIDLIVGIGATLVSFVALIGVLMLWRASKGQKLL